jgi:hypothetical protein
VSDAGWIEIDTRERTLLLDALAALRESNRAEAWDIANLAVKLVHSSHHPQITVGVHGGQSTVDLRESISHSSMRLRRSER